MRNLTATIALLAVSTPLSAEGTEDKHQSPAYSPLGAEEWSADKEAEAYLDRIARFDDAGPMINAVIAFEPEAPNYANEAFEAGTLLEGRTVLVKDNIETVEFPTTAGSLALKDNMTGRDAPLIANLRDNGGVVLGKTNLSEWANIRDNNSTSGWSAVGGLTRNPFATDRNSCGSSSGSGAAIAAGFAWAAIGTETNGSIICPASINGIVGFKPSVGLVSRTHVVPISSTQDTAGPMTRTVYDAALLLTAIAGEDPADAVTVNVPRVADYTAGLSETSLEGVRIGVLRNQLGDRQDVKQVFAKAVADLEAAGAVLVNIDFEPDWSQARGGFTVLLYELREEMGKYLSSIPAINGDESRTPRSLADLIAFNEENADSELRWFGQDIFIQAEGTTDRDEYEAAKERAVGYSKKILDQLLIDNQVDVLIAPSRGPAWVSDLVNGDNFGGSIGFGSPAAVAGYPHLTVPMGDVENLPIGLSFIGAKWNDHRVLQIGAAYEKARTVWLPAPSFEPWKPAE